MHTTLHTMCIPAFVYIPYSYHAYSVGVLSNMHVTVYTPCTQHVHTASPLNTSLCMSSCTHWLFPGPCQPACSAVSTRTWVASIEMSSESKRSAPLLLVWGAGNVRPTFACWPLISSLLAQSVARCRLKKNGAYNERSVFLNLPLYRC